MPTELNVLALAGLLQVIQYLLMAIPVNAQMGVRYTGGNRDEERRPTGTPGRLFRALDNHFEALLLFTVAVLVVVLGDRSSPLTEACAWVYLVARLVYVPAYASGVFLVRSLVWTVGFVATTVMLLAALLAPGP